MLYVTKQLKIHLDRGQCALPKSKAEANNIDCVWIDLDNVQDLFMIMFKISVSSNNLFIIFH